MRLGVRATLLLCLGYAVLTAALGIAVEGWLRRFEQATTSETVRLLAREKGALLAERSYDALLTPDAASRRRLRKQIEDLMLVSETVSSLSVVDAEGRVLAGDGQRPGSTLAKPQDVFRDDREIQAEAASSLSFFEGGDYVVRVPLEDGQRVIGYLRIGFHNRHVAGLFRDARRQLLWLALLGLAAVGLLGLLLQIQVSRSAASIAQVLDGPERASGSVLPQPQNEFNRALAAASRVRRALNDARRESTRLHQGFSALADVMKMGVLLLRPDRTLDFANARAVELFGVSTQEQLAPLWARVLPTLSHAFQTPGRGAGERTIQVPLAQGGSKPLRVDVYRLGGDDCDEHLVLINDPQILETLESDVRLASQLEGLARMYRTAAHELRAPLSAVMINLDLLRETLDAPESEAEVVKQRQERYVGVLSEELARLNRTLAEILTQTIPPPGSQRRFELHHVLRELATLLAAPARRQGVEVSLRLPGPEAEAVVLVGYRDRLKQVFLNIAVNALEAMPDGGRLEFLMECSHEGVRVSVRDSGPGIPQALLERIYEPDFTTKGGGSGIGLYVARALVQLHGGNIEVRSEAGCGTQVVVDLPLVPRT